MILIILYLIECSSAFLYVRDIFHSVTHPTVISFGYRKGIWEEFSWTGTRDYRLSRFFSPIFYSILIHIPLNSPYMALSAAIDLRRKLTDKVFPLFSFLFFEY